MTMAAGLPTDELDPVTFEPIVVTGEREALLGRPDSATEGVVLPEQLAARPAARPGELLEFVPGLIATQHSGEGKANQYFLRGFNLDHGTDFSIRVDGLPVNQPTHGHGQGYADLSFLIPEMVDQLAYRKGPYYADVGDFSLAGSADLTYTRNLAPTLALTVGEFGYRRGFAGGTYRMGAGDLTGGFGVTVDDGPWVLDEDLRQVQGVLRYARGDDTHGLTLSVQGYDGRWTSTDQIAQRAVSTVGRFGFLDDDVGGESHRYSVAFDLRRPAHNGHWNLAGYGIDSALDLFSNFTYFLENPMQGDEFEQVDDRRVYGLSGHRHFAIGAPHQHDHGHAHRHTSLAIGFDVRHDDIDEVGLFNTQDRQRFNTVRSDAVRQTLAAVYVSAERHLLPRLRSTAGLRFNVLDVDVDAGQAVNAGSARDELWAPSLSLVAGPFSESELFLNLGRGFHSNDARGATITQDPVSGDPADAVPLLVAGEGIDLGLRSARLPRTQLAVSLWHLALDSELVFVGDGGATEASGASRRRGLELAAFVDITKGVIFDASFAATRARFTNGDRVPNAPERVASAGVTWEASSKLSGGLRLRYLGPAPLVEDNSARSPVTTLVNAQVSYAVSPKLSLRLEGFNLLDSDDNDITYFYASRLPGEPAEGVEDFHFHPVEPRTVRLGLSARFD